MPHGTDPLRLELEQPLEDVEQPDAERPARRHLVHVQVDPPPPVESVLDPAPGVDVLEPTVDVDAAAVAAVVLEVELVRGRVVHEVVHVVVVPDGVDAVAEGAALVGAARAG